MIEIYRAYDEEIRKIYRANNMKHLHEIKIGDGGTSGFLIDVLRSKEIFHPMSSSEFKMEHEMDFITCDIKYITAVLLLLRPYINDSSTDNTHYQTIEDRRYLMYTTFGLQAVYNFWDRVGDLLWHFFPSTLLERDVYFDRVMAAIDISYKATKPYQELKQLYENEVKPVLAERKEAVHYFQPESRHYWGQVENYGNKAKLVDMYRQKFAYADVMKRQLEITWEAFQLMVNLINELPDKVA